MICEWSSGQKSSVPSTKPYGAAAIRLLLLCQQLSISFPFSTLIFDPQMKEELASIEYPCIFQNSKLEPPRPQESGLVPAAWKKKSAGDDLFLCSCYHDGETLTDLQIPKGVILLTASNPAFFFLNITYHSNKKQVWSWNTTLTHRHISRFSPQRVI